MYNVTTAPTFSQVGSQLNPFQQEKVVQYLKLVKWIVGKLCHHLPSHIQSDDLVHTGILGLIDAVQRFQWGREREDEEFKDYAECRIRGQIMDELRRLDVLPRSVREQVNRYRKALEELRKILNRIPEDHEVAEYLKVDLETCFRLKADANYGKQIPIDNMQSGVSTMEGIIRETLNLVNPDTPEGLLHLEEVKKILADEIDQLQDRERQVVSLYYLEEMTLKEIGSILEVTESRISQIHALAMEKLVKRLKIAFKSETPWEEPGR